LHAVPEKAKNDKLEREEVSRLKKLERDGKEPDMPPFDGPKYMLDFFWEVGPAMSGGMGSAPLTHGELESWQRNIGIKLNPWECRTLKRLSVEYVNESHKATKRDHPAPWQPVDVSGERKKQVAQDMMAAMRQMAAD